MPPRHIGMKKKRDEEGKTPPRHVENIHNEKEMQRGGEMPPRHVGKEETRRGGQTPPRRIGITGKFPPNMKTRPDGTFFFGGAWKGMD